MRQELMHGVFYSAIAKYSGIITSLIVSGVLARLISPEEFGIVAIATVIISFFSIFSDLGIAPAIIQNKELSKNDMNNIFSFTLWMGICISILFFFSSWLIAWGYSEKSFQKICQLLTINLFFASLNIVPNAILLKNKEFKFIAYRSLIIQLIGGGIAICFAMQGAGIYSLIINPILSSVLLFIISYKKHPLLIIKTTGITSVRKIFRFSAYQFLFNVINYFSRNLDKLLIGKYMAMQNLGYYEKSYRLMMLPLQNITNVISPVMHPIFSDLQNDLQKLSTSYEKVVRTLAFIGFPLSALLWFCSKEIVVIVFGAQWLPSIPVFQILSISIGFQIILSTSGSIFQATNETKSLFICGLISTALNVSGILIGLFVFKSLVAIAWCICITFISNFAICFFWMYYFTFKRSLFHIGKTLLSPLCLTFLLTTILYPIYIITTDSPVIISFCIKSTIFLLVFSIYIQKSGTYDIFKLIKSKISS